MVKSKTYTIDTICSNCDYDGKCILPRGMKVSEVLPKSECPQCGCNTLSKKSKITPKPFLTNPRTIPCNLPHYPPQPHLKCYPSITFHDRAVPMYKDKIWCANDDKNKLRMSTTSKVQSMALIN